jgi:hypothetical protein
MGACLNTEVLSIECDSSPKWGWLLRELLFLATGLGDLRQSHLQDQDLQLAVWQLFSSGTLSSEWESSYGRLARAIVGQPDFSMAQPEALRLESFIADFTPPDAPADEGQFSLESSKARSKLSEFQLATPKPLWCT